jgi:peroxiredoxin
MRFLPAALALGLAAPALSQDNQLKVKEGDPIPDIAVSAVQPEKAVPDKKGATTLNVRDVKGKNVVLFFFPRANTKG